MKNLLPGFQFIIYTAFLKNTQLGADTVLTLPDRETPAIVYLPKGKEKGLIITFTGFAIVGYRDQRMAVVNNAFARLGYRVITPKINTIDALRIHPTGVEEVKEVIEAIAKDKSLNPHGFAPAVFAPSFTAGIASLAIAQLPKDRVSSLCLLGSFCEFESTIAFALANENNEDDYGMHILMKNFLGKYMSGYPGMEALVQTALEDNGLRRKDPQLPQLLKEVSPETALAYQKICTDAAFRNEKLLESYTYIEQFETWKHQLDVSKHTQYLHCPVSIIHGKEDKVIAPEQSILLHTLLRPHNAKVRLELSALLDHGDPKIGWGILGEVASLSKAFGHFMKHIK